MQMKATPFKWYLTSVNWGQALEVLTFDPIQRCCGWELRSAAAQESKIFCHEWETCAGDCLTWCANLRRGFFKVDPHHRPEWAHHRSHCGSATASPNSNSYFSIYAKTSKEQLSAKRGSAKIRKHRHKSSKCRLSCLAESCVHKRVVFSI